jgi:hypothetical protein
MQRQDVNFAMTLTIGACTLLSVRSVRLHSAATHCPLLRADMVFFREAYTFFQPEFSLMTAYPWPGRTVGGFMGYEAPYWARNPQGAADAFYAQIIDTLNMLGNKLKSADMAWEAIVAVSADLRNAAQQFDNIVGQQNAALTRVFRPGKIYEYGCFDSRWEGGNCIKNAPRVKVMGRRIGGQCIAWAPYTLVCGSTQRCIKNCR